MADLTVTIENRLNVFGPAPSNKWGDWDWATLIWGEGNSDLVTAFGKSLSNSLALTDGVTKTFSRTINNTLAPMADMGSETLQNGDWFYNFVSNTDDAEERDVADWTEDSDADTPWTDGSSSDTDWSE